MNRTSRVTEREILALYFHGISRDEMAKMVGVAPSTVSEVIGILPEGFRDARVCSVELKKQNLSVFDAKKGAELRRRMNDLGVSVEQLQSFVESTEKMQSNPDYESKKVIQCAMKLNDLEKFGKTYPEALVDFEKKNDSIKQLETKEHDLIEQTKTLEIEKKRKMAQNNVTQREIDYTVDLRQSLRNHGAELSDAESLLKCLENMRETGGNPRVFVEYTREHGSLKGRTALLRQEIQEHTQSVQSLRGQEEIVQAAVNKSLSVRSELDRQKEVEQAKLLAVRRELTEVQDKEAQELVKLGQLLNVEARAEKVTEALAVKKAKLSGLDSEIDEKQAQVQSLEHRGRELENRNESIEGEIKVKLRINDYATQLLSALEELQRQQLSLNEENEKKRAKTAVADTMTSFLTKQSPTDFNRFYMQVELIKKMRDSPRYQTSLQLTIAEEEARMLALQAFKGLLATTSDYALLQYQKRECDEKNARLEEKVEQLESRLKDAESKLGSELKEKKLTEAVKANFEGRVTTVAEIKSFMLKMFDEEIKRRANEKFNWSAAATCGLINLVSEKITGRSNMPWDVGQS